MTHGRASDAPPGALAVATAGRGPMATATTTSSRSPRQSSRQRAIPYVDALRAYAHLHPTRLNVPGHKGGSGADPALVDLLGEACFEVDVPPLLWGVDSGESPTPLEEALGLAAECWGARRTWFLTNGASQGNHVACLALRALGERALVQRSVHSSVIDGLAISGIRPTFLAPTIDARFGIAHGLVPAALADAIARQPDVIAAYVVSPSYFGAVADVGGLADVAHDAGLPLVVDEAWGSHFGFHPALPASALQQGADIVISSTHKMAGSLTQSAMLHLGEGPFSAQLEPLLARALTMVQSTSASSLLLASLDAARHRMATRARTLIEGTLAAAGEIRERLAALDHVSLANRWFLQHEDVVALDPLRIAIDVAGTGLTGHEVAAVLRADYAIDVEVAHRRAIVAVLGASEDGTASIPGLVEALASLPRRPVAIDDEDLGAPPWGEPVISPRDAAIAPAVTLAADDAVGRVSTDTLAAYPPGIPNVIPGERITRATLDFMHATVGRGGFVRGALTPDISLVRAVDDPTL